MKIIINSHMNNENWGGQFVYLILDRELIPPESISLKNKICETPEEIQWSQRNYFKKQFEIGVTNIHPEYSKKRVECFESIKSYIEETWGRFLDKKQWIKELMNNL